MWPFPSIIMFVLGAGTSCGQDLFSQLEDKGQSACERTARTKLVHRVPCTIHQEESAHDEPVELEMGLVASARRVIV